MLAIAQDAPTPLNQFGLYSVFAAVLSISEILLNITTPNTRLCSDQHDLAASCVTSPSQWRRAPAWFYAEVVGSLTQTMCPCKLDLPAFISQVRDSSKWASWLASAPWPN